MNFPALGQFQRGNILDINTLRERDRIRKGAVTAKGQDLFRNIVLRDAIFFTVPIAVVSFKSQQKTEPRF